VFLVNVPVALVVWWALSRSAVDVGMPRGRLGDRSGTLLLTGWTVAVTVALVQGPTWGWRSPATLGALALGVVMLVGFVVVEFRSTSPLLDLRLFASRGLSGSVLLNFSNNAVFVAFTFLMSLYLQVALGYSAMEAGAFFVAASGAALLVGPFTDRLVLRLGLAAVGVGAAVLTAGGLLAVTALSPGASVLVGIGAFVLVGCGVATLANSAAIGMSVSVADEEEGAASGVFNTAAMLASSLGVVVGSLVFGAIAMSHFTDATERTGTGVDGVPGTEIDYLVTGEATVPTRDALVSPKVAELAVDSFASGIAWTMVILAAVLVLASAASGLMLRGEPTRAR
jgi:Na+/melibiose symporter-like transporter